MEQNEDSYKLQREHPKILTFRNRRAFWRNKLFQNRMTLDCFVRWRKCRPQKEDHWKRDDHHTQAKSNDSRKQLSFPGQLWAPSFIPTTAGWTTYLFQIPIITRSCLWTIFKNDYRHVQNILQLNNRQDAIKITRILPLTWTNVDCAIWITLFTSSIYPN